MPLKSQKGITLIALVITIIVLLILAGVTLKLVFNGGIIEKSQNAVDKYSQTQQNETEILDYLNKQFSLHIIVLNNINGTENKKVIESTTTGQYYNPVVPVGFKTVNTKTASWEVVEDKALGTIVKGWNDGLVIEDKEGNQFVWVPVDGTDVTYTKKWFSLVYKAGTKIDIQSSDLNDTELPDGISNEQTQIDKYGGFYIARYEAGLPESMTEAINSIDERNVGGIPVSKKNQEPWNYINYDNAKKNAENMYKNEFVKSGLITGKQWDTVMLWLENSEVNVQTDSTSWGNYPTAAVTGITTYSTFEDYNNHILNWINVDSTTKRTSYPNHRWLLKSGHTDYTKVKNIYDLAGNLWEYTSERCQGYSVLVRGGACDNGVHLPAANRTVGNSSSNASFNTGFRVILYIM